MEGSGMPGDVVFRMILQSFSSSALMSREKMMEVVLLKIIAGKIHIGSK
jgi:hypothetical protein